MIPGRAELTIPLPVPSLETFKAYVILVKVAVTLRAWIIVTEHVPVPVQAPLHPEKVEMASGVGVSVTGVPFVYVSEQSDPQSIPVGEEATVPLPVPERATDNANMLGGVTEKFAVTTASPLTVTTHGPVPLHPPPVHPSNWDVPLGVAVNVTDCPTAKFSEQSAPQEIPAGDEVIVPPPKPVFSTKKLLSVAAGLEKLAVTVLSASKETTHVPVPEHPPPDHPEKTIPVSGSAVRVTTVPAAKAFEQVDPQSNPA